MASNTMVPKSGKKAKAAISSNSLKGKVTEFILSQPEFKSSLKSLLGDIQKQAKAADNEATFAQHFETLLHSFLKENFGLSFLPSKEEKIGTLRHTAKGRMDSRLGALIIEYKHRSALKNKPEQTAATTQIVSYMQSLHGELNHVVGLVTDGLVAKFIILSSIDGLVESSFDSLSVEHLDRLIRNIILLEKTAFTPENLVKDFCTEDGVASRLSSALFSALKQSITPRSQMLFNEWKALFKLAHDDVSKQTAIQERREALAAALKIVIPSNDNETEYMALYAIQTAYAIILKVIAYKVIETIRPQGASISFAELAEANSATIRTHLSRLEEGAVFRDMGFGNLLEGDFFAWYCTGKQWNEGIATCIKGVFSVLTQYEDHKVFDANIKIQDLFKDLYMHIIPDKVRHSLGEFYTPPWLADNLVIRALQLSEKKKNWKGIDPCCGSGTFITILMRKVLADVAEKSKKDQLFAVLNRVKGIDLNPLAVLTSRINYFINLSHLIDDDDEFEIPVYLGDSSYMPQRVKIGNVDCLQYQIATLKGQIDIRIPLSSTNNPASFSRTMTEIETHIKNQDEDAISEAILKLTKKTDITDAIKAAVNDLAARLVDLEKNDWNGIWARIITNFLTTANIGKFDVIVGNPPWIDWKNLPANYRERIKSLCLDRKLFSGDSVTGGINLNVCALISNVAAENWLAADGILAFLMPENMIFQQSYEGFRKFYVRSDERLFFQELYDWTAAGHPFHPVQYKFLTYFMSSKENNYQKGIPVKQFIKKSGKGSGKKALSAYRNHNTFAEVASLFEMREKTAFVPSSTNTIFAYAKTPSEIEKFSKISGVSAYPGREGVEFYPQELFLLKLSEKQQRADKAFLTNYQNSKSKHKIASTNLLLETKYLYPLIKGVNIQRFHVDPTEFYVPFPYDKNFSSGRKPVDKKELTKQSPALMKYFNENKHVMEAQTSYNEKIIGKKNNSEFYAIARVGEYSHAECYVAFRDNTKWQAAVVTPIKTPWGEKKHPVFQNHAVTICERPKGGFISEDEAHFICAILNAPVVGLYMTQSSDSRSFKIRPPVKIPEYDAANIKHQKLRDLSKKAHKNYNNVTIMNEIDAELDKIYLSIL